MPKRRLGYGQVAIEAKAPPLSQTRRSPPAPNAEKPGPTQQRSSSRGKTSDVLLKLSRSCKFHAEHWHSDWSGAVEEDEESIPAHCKGDLEGLRNLLPKIEEKFQPPATGQKGPEAHDVAHLCDFYISVMKGNYCPHAPHLFHLGKSPTDVISRVHFLFRHLITPAIVSTSKKEAVFSSSDPANETPQPVLQTLSQTIAHLLSFLVSPSIRSSILLDLVNLLEDCCFLLEDKVLPIKLSLFAETCESSSLDLDCALDIYQLDQLWTIQTATLMALSTFMADLRVKAMQPQSAATLGSDTDCCPSKIPSGWVDLEICIPHHLFRGEMISTLTAALRSIVLLESCPTKVSGTLFCQGKVAAAQILKRLLSDWSRLAPSMCSFVECSMLVVQAVRISMKTGSEEPVEYVKLLSEMLHFVVMEPPNITGQPFFIGNPCTVRMQVLPPLLDCVHGIERKQVNARNSLDAMVLMAIHLLLQQGSSKTNAKAYCLANVRIVPSLLDLSQDPRLSNHAVAILVVLFGLITTADEINSISHAVLEAHEQDPKENDANSASRESNDTTTVGSKRKRESIKSRSKPRSPIRALELSPSKKTTVGKNPFAVEVEGRQMAFQSWIVVLRSTLTMGMDAARRLTEKVSYLDDDVTVSGSRKKGASALNDASQVACTLRLVSRIITNYLGTVNVELDQMSSLFRVGQRLLEAIEGACIKLSAVQPDSIGESGSVLHQIIVDSALDLHYSVGIQLLEPTNLFLRKLLNLLVSSSTLARKLLQYETSFSAPGIHSFDAYDLDSSTSLMQALSLSVPEMEHNAKDSFFSRRKAFLRRFESSVVQQAGCDFLSVASLELVTALPLGVRCSLLSSLYPEGCAVTDTLRMSDGPQDLDSLFKALIHQEPKDPAAIFVLFLPLYIASFTLAASKPLDRKICSDFLIYVLADFMVPLSNTPFQGNVALCRALLFVAGKIQIIATRPFEFVAALNPRFDAFATLKEVATMNLAPSFDSGHDVHNLQLEIQVNEFVDLLARKIPEDHGDDVVRRLRWFCMAILAFRSSTSEIRERALVTANSLAAETPVMAAHISELRSQSRLLWLVKAPFLDDNHHFREETSRILGRLLLSGNDSFLLAHFCSDDYIQTLAGFSVSGQNGRPSTHQSYEVEAAAENVVSEFFRDIDELLHSSIGVSDSQLSFTMANSGSGQMSRKGQRSQASTLSMEKTAVKILASFCRRADTSTPIGKFFFEKAFQRLVRIWANNRLDRTGELPISSLKALAFTELSHIAGHQVGGRPLWWQQSAQFTAIIISDILVLQCDADRETQFSQVEGFIRTIVAKDLSEALVNTRTLKTARNFVEESLPAILAQFIDEKSMEHLRLITAFRQFLIERIRRVRKHPTGEPRVVGTSNAPDTRKYNSVNAATDDLEEQTKNLCLDKEVLDRLLPLLFMRLDTHLSFFTQTVLKGEETLGSLIKARDQTILKGLVWKLGKEPGIARPARVAIRAAAAARTIDKTSAFSESEVQPTAEIKLGKLWVTSNFMYLLVSVVQYRWKARTLLDRLYAVRCLHSLLDFLVAQEAPQYFPQIMGTVNAAIVDGDGENWVGDEDRSNASSLRLYAVKSLSKFVRLVVDVQLETIALNLTTIVVALLPVVDEPDDACLLRSEYIEAREVAVSLLDFLTAGDLGRSLAEHFKEIPFLPASQSLESVHRSLRSNGVDFDNLAVLSTTSQHGALVGKDYSMDATDISATMGSTLSSDTEKVVALQKRLSLICALLENEITSVRKIALQHLTDLLRANRVTFHALVRTESSLSGKRLLTVTTKDAAGNPRWASQGSVTTMMERLLARCVAESDDEVRLRLATCLGEVGAISEARLGEVTVGSSMGDEVLDGPKSSYKWRLEQPPWQSQDVKYELQLVTRHLVVALKAATSSTDQHKIAFAIQQLLRLLNSSVQQSEADSEEVAPSAGMETMSKWLKETLEQSGQYELIEPYFSSDFQEKAPEGYSTKKPPFVRISSDYYSWVTNFCRWMIQGSKKSDRSPWKDLFFACRTAIRTEAGLNVAEFIMPLLVLDRICFGTPEDRLLLQQELADVLRVDTNVYMDASERQRVVNVVFTTIDTLAVWSEREIEERSKGRSSNATSSKGTIRRRVSTKPVADSFSRNWPAEESIEKITELLKSIPLSLQAEAAETFGMHARSLQRLELEARESTTLQIFEKSAQEQKKDALKGEKSIFQTFGVPVTESFNIELMKNVLSRLDDCETMAAIRKDSLFFNPLQQIRDNIREKEACDDYESALQEYERALQASSSQDRNQSFVKGSLRCLMELGRYESVLNQVGGLQRNKQDYGSRDAVQEALVFAVEAAWKLGRWQTLSEVLQGDVNKSITDTADTYQIFTGKAMLCLHRDDHSAVKSAIRGARESVMQNLSSAASESYARSYGEIVKLQSLRELENANELFSIGHDSQFDLDEIAHSTAVDGWSWNDRVDLVTSGGALSVVGTRIALARLRSDPVLVGSLFLESGHRARKTQRWTIAENLLSQARAAVADLKGDKLAGNPKLFHLVYSSQVQLAKLKYASGECAVALKILGQQAVDRTISEMLPNIEKPDVLGKLATESEKRLIHEFSGISADDYEDDQKLAKRFAVRLLQLTRWVSESGLQRGSEVMGRFQLIQKLAPEWEKGQFHFGKFVDSLLQTRMAAMATSAGVAGRESLNGIDDNETRNRIILQDHVCQTHTLLAMHRYASALNMDTKHVYQALPRLLSLWFSLVSVGRDQPESSSKQDHLHVLRQHQNQANTFMASQIRDIPPAAFYTAMPQLISRVIHEDRETSMVVKSILQRVLTKFPEQAMWPLAWLKGSKIENRKQIGEEIFNGAQNSLSRQRNRTSKLIKLSDSLFEHLRKLASLEGTPERPHSSSITVKPWRSPEVDLCEFVPPIQAALAITPTSTDQSNSKNHFLRTIPRMRAFSSRVSVMTSKAKPKKLKAYAVQSTYRPSAHPQRSASTPGTKSRSQEEVDIGELHFLVKQEAKGDLRKDQRVQDLNNVINRLMASNNGESGASSRRRHRLHLRTFAVTCLSEDIGILEWVPETDSLRNLVSQSYNPQTSANCPRRRGTRLANFGDATLRSHYEMCQNKYFKEGNLTKAASMFEDHLLRPYPPLLYWWFVQKFHDPHAWYEARNRFTLSAAAWSAVGHVIGLGDRHSENILVDTSSGECVHVDFDCIFDKGLNLPRPEVVPFRLTANMLDAFGPTGADGIYTAGLQTAMRTLRDNRDTLLSVLEPFLNDPVIDWKRHRGQQKSSSTGISARNDQQVAHTDKQTKEAKRSIQVIDERLQGIYNLRNPNLKKYKRRDRPADQDDEYSHLVPLPVEGQVQRMIQEATSQENLVQLYVGWMPWV